MIISRILQIIELKGISKRKFYLKTGLSNGFLDKQRDIGVSKVENILQAYPDVNPMWLLLGKGDIFMEDKDDSVLQKITQADQKEDIEHLRKEIEHLNEKLKEKEERLKDKEEIIRLMKSR